MHTGSQPNADVYSQDPNAELAYPSSEDQRTESVLPEPDQQIFPVSEGRFPDYDWAASLDFSTAGLMYPNLE